MKNTSQPTKIFVVEDDPMYQRMIKYILDLNPDHQVFVFSTGQECIQNLHHNPDIISLDHTLPDMTGMEVLKKIKSHNVDIDVIILSGQQDISTAVKLLKAGAYDYITKDEETKERILNTLANIKNKISLKEEVYTLREALNTKFQFDKMIIGDSPAMQKVFRMLEKAVQTNITVSISGATGTGKEVIAKSIHYNSNRKKGPIVAVNMSAIPKDLLESELFGYEKGAFTGALTRRKGFFEMANNGTLFLDEIAEMDVNLQAKVLRAVQEREVLRVGGEDPVPFDARIIVATHKDLATEVNNGNFREDLFYRLLGLPIELPPLRDRGNDILLLAKHFLEGFINANQLNPIELTKKAKDKLLAYSYPGNVRELKAIIELAAVISDGSKIQSEDITFNSPRRVNNFLVEETTFEAYKRKIINHFLEKYNNDIPLVAEKLDIGKSTIYRMLKMEKFPDAQD